MDLKNPKGESGKNLSQLDPAKFKPPVNRRNRFLKQFICAFEGNEEALQWLRNFQEFRSSHELSEEVKMQFRSADRNDSFFYDYVNFIPRADAQLASSMAIWRNMETNELRINISRFTPDSLPARGPLMR